MKADLILSADWHLREDSPKAWAGDFHKAQATTLEFLSDLQEEHGFCPIVIAGDFFHHWKISHAFERWAMRHIPKGQLFVVPGQHDLRHHRLKTLNETALSVFIESKFLSALSSTDTRYDDGECVMDLYGFPWTSQLRSKRRKTDAFKVAVCHIMTYKTKRPFPGCTSDNASKLMKKMAGFDLIVTGDNHEPFIVEKENRLLVNPGSLQRQTAAQADHRPRVYLWNAEEASVEAVYLPMKKKDISREHIDLKEEHEKRITAFVTKLDEEDISIELSFKENLKMFMNRQRIKKKVQDCVWQAVEE